MGLDSGARAQAAKSKLIDLLVNSITDYAIYVLSTDGTVLTWNPGGERIKGYRAEEVIGTNFSRFYVESDAQFGLPSLSLATAAEQGRFSAEGWRVRKDGSRFWASVVIDSIVEDGCLVGFAKITRDITDRYEASRQLQASQQALLASQNLENIGKLTLGLAHDFNNLLTVMVNSVELMRSRLPDDPKAQVWAAAAMKAADRGNLLTRQLLSYGKGSKHADEVTSVNAVVESSSELLGRACVGAVQLVVELGPEGSMPVLIDPAQLEAAVLNLVVNARDAVGKEGGVCVATRREQRLNPNDPHGPLINYAVVEVRDDGCGMSPDVLAKASQPFFTTKDVGEGSGLGLSQVHGFAAQSGGFVDIQSAAGQGTQVSVFLPIWNTGDPSP
jgi:PAS domain S-box-containing protein